MSFTSIKDLQLKDKIVLLRADLNVPRQDGRVSDTTRIDRLKPTIDYLRSAGARTLILSHFGRPEGEHDSGLSMAFLIPTLSTHWDCNVSFVQNCIGERAQTAASTLKNGDVALLENVRFHKGEKQNDHSFAEQLAALGDIYINDAFSAAHRAHASTEAIARLLPSAAGLLMEQELNALDKALETPQKPVAAIVGGSKVSTKLSVLKNLSAKVDYLILGGGMANTFLKSTGANIGNSLCEDDMLDEARDIAAFARSNACEIIVPIDAIAVMDIQTNGSFKTLPSNQISDDHMAIDAGPETIEYISNKIENCKTILWNGPMGVFEIKPFDAGTNALAQKVAALTKNKTLISIAGGGDTISALENAGVAKDFTYISTAGGAFLEWLEGKELPGVAALKDTD